MSPFSGIFGTVSPTACRQPGVVSMRWIKLTKKEGRRAIHKTNALVNKEAL